MITINVWPNKLVNNKMWKQYSEPEQKQLLKDVVRVAFAMESTGDLKDKLDRVLFFEKCKSGNIHVHFMLTCTEDTIERAKAYVHYRLGLPSADPSRVFMYTQTIVDTSYGHEYCRKEQVDDDYVPSTNIFYHMYKSNIK